MEKTTERPHEAVAGEVRAALARRRISARQAAREIGWKPAYIWRRLDGRTPLDVNDLVALAELLDVPVTTFFVGLPVKVTKDALSPLTPLNPALTCITLTRTQADAYLAANPAA